MHPHLTCLHCPVQLPVDSLGHLHAALEMQAHPGVLHQCVARVSLRHPLQLHDGKWDTTVATAGAGVGGNGDVMVATAVPD